MTYVYVFSSDKYERNIANSKLKKGYANRRDVERYSLKDFFNALNGENINIDVNWVRMIDDIDVLEQKKFQWHDVEKCLPEENVYVICRYDDYYFIGYMEDGTWYNHSAGDTILETDDITVEYWKRFDT
jgi:hypothetical protein